MITLILVILAFLGFEGIISQNFLAKILPKRFLRLDKNYDISSELENSIDG